ncbi:hypothetical protein, partial [Microbulbifer sp.]|uniref:hypothetical protein n=1 Tax=Microbulbifer sp. TaxID=1908541 RepID=UPI003F2A77EB
MKFCTGIAKPAPTATMRKARPQRIASYWAVATSVLALLVAPLVFAKPGISSDGAAPRATSSENREDLEDMQVKVLGGSVRMLRRWTPNGWEWNSRWNPIQTYSELRAEQGETAPISGNCKQPYEFYLFRNGMSYRPEKFATDVNNCIAPDGDTYQALLVQTLTKREALNGDGTSTYYTWRDRSGNVIHYTNGQIVDYEDKNGVRVSFTYEQDRIKSVEDHHGNTVITYHWALIPGESDQYRLASLED